MERRYSAVVATEKLGRRITELIAEQQGISVPNGG